MPRTTGKYLHNSISGEDFASFIPYPLPPTKPALRLEARSLDLLKQAEQQLSRLDLAGGMVPSLEWFIYAFVRKEAVVSSQIEGTQATLIDLLTYEASVELHHDEETTAEVHELCNYLEALNHSRKQLLKPNGLPISMRLLNEAHRLLMKGVRGAAKQPGKVRQSQNWIGGTRPGNAAFVPPPPQEIPRLLSDLEKYIHQGDSLHPLVRIGLIHVQFETMHPYLDGNGRIGRLLITLLFEHFKLLTEPLLYLSLFFKQQREEYYRLLSRVRTEGDWESWIRFFLEGVSTIAKEAVTAARDLFNLVTTDRSRVIDAPNASVMSIRLLEKLPHHPIVTIPGAVQFLGATEPTVAKAVGVLEELGILAETTGRRRDRTFAYAAYLKRLREGTDLERA